MKSIVTLLLGLLVGFGIGWYFGYSRPIAQYERKLLADAQVIRTNFHMTDAEVIEFEQHLPEYRESQKRSDEFAARFAVVVISSLEQGDVPRVKTEAVDLVAAYYRRHQNDGDTNLLALIRRGARTSPGMAEAIHKQ